MADKKQQDWLVRRLEDAANAVEGELAQEGARMLRDDELGQLQALVEELETLSLAIVYDEVDAR